MFTARFDLIGISDFMFGKHVTDEKRDDETWEQNMLRTWAGKLHRLPSGQLHLPPFALKNAFIAAGKWLRMKLQGSSTYTKRFAAGINEVEKMPFFGSDWQPLTIDDIDPMVIFVPSNGKSGDAGTRVDRVFPTLHDWRIRGQIIIFDTQITEDVFDRHLTAIGKFVGLGAMRVDHGGINGRFLVENLTFTSDD